MKVRNDAKSAQTTLLNDAGELNVNRDGTAASWHRAFILQAEAHIVIYDYTEIYSYRETSSFAYSPSPFALSH